MKTSLFVPAILMTAPALRAQIINDNATSALSNVTHTVFGDVTVDANSSFKLLIPPNNLKTIRN